MSQLGGKLGFSPKDRELLTAAAIEPLKSTPKKPPAPAPKVDLSDFMQKLKDTGQL
jgi:hypothetical protein